MAVVIKTGNQWPDMPQAEVNEAVRLYTEEDLSMWRISKILRRHHYTIRKALIQAGVDAKAKYAKGTRHGQWKGGRYTDANGYVWVRLGEGDPLTCMAYRNGYAQEHRYVMAQSLGRPLEKRETVHHIDGDRTNNALENLQLRQGKHGSGVVLTCRHCGSHDIKRERL